MRGGVSWGMGRGFCPKGEKGMICYKCGQEHPDSDHHWKDRAHTKRHEWCRFCLAAASKASREKKIEHYRAMNRAWNKDHSNKIRGYQRRYWAKVVQASVELDQAIAEYKRRRDEQAARLTA